MMTQEELDLIKRIIRGQSESLAYRAAQLVLVEGRSQTEAERYLNTSAQAVQNGVTRYSKWNNEIKKAYKLDK
ncbi:hypothetical protein [Shewanella algae]|uniref:hypothetical protein n=1 Tax=Shewanella algae TaxID=38313 RepID=UPI0011829A1F|nr:hypothetical protein [Shewanella algae]MBO2558990.1 hypothetical protein [Shewanella algae]MBO2575856.1 hypothetical protein [Shewanella algae]TVO81361.1 hypothetical protein AYI80_21270 [Shewanella algae]TXS81979.1 hypothetical protein AYI81_21230 [Shewanella algae]